MALAGHLPFPVQLLLAAMASGGSSLLARLQQLPHPVSPADAQGVEQITEDLHEVLSACSMCGLGLGPALGAEPRAVDPSLTRRPCHRLLPNQALHFLGRDSDGQPTSQLSHWREYFGVPEQRLYYVNEEVRLAAKLLL